MSGSAAGTSGTSYALNLSTTGGSAAEWIVNWGDGTTPSTYFAANQPGGTFGTSFVVQHAYNAQGNYIVSGSAYQAGSSTPATTQFGLGSDFGMTPASFSGQTVFNPYGNSGSSSPVYMSVDSLTRPTVDDGDGDPGIGFGFIYVASEYNNNRIAVSRFSSNGTIDGTFGTNGTLVLQSGGSGFFPNATSEVDTPTAIQVDFTDDDGPNVVVSGTATYMQGGTQHTSWIAADISPGYPNYNGCGSSAQSTISWQATSAQGLPTTGSPNAITFNQVGPLPNDEADVILAGTDGTHMVALALIDSEVVDGRTFSTGGVLDTNFGTNGVTQVTIPGLANSPTITASANTVTQSLDTENGVDSNGNSVPINGDYYLGGNVTYTAHTSGGSAYTASDFVIVRLSPTGVFDPVNNPTFGTGDIVRTNFGSSLTGSTASSSFDSAYSLVEWDAPGQNNQPDSWYITAVGSTNVSGGKDHFALAQYNEADGSLNSGFGKFGGLAIGPAGDAYAAVLQANATDTLDPNDPNATILAAGTNGSDFLIARFNSAGNLDTTFGNNGVRTIDFGNSSANSVDAAHSIGLQYIHNDDDDIFNVSDIIVGGYTSLNSGNNQIALADIVPSNSANIAPGSAVHPNATISGSSTTTAGSGLYHLSLQKGKDSSLTSWTIFWGDGSAPTTVSGSTTFANHTFVTAGTYNITANYSDGTGTFAATTMLPDGTFGAAGVAVTAQSSSSLMTVASDGSLLVADTFNNGFRLRRYTSAGILDNSFGVNGTATVSFTGTLSVNAITVLPDGDIVIAGVNNGMLALAAFTSSPNPVTGVGAGQLDASFGTNGIVIQGLGTPTAGHYNDQIYSLAFDSLIGSSGGDLLVAGSSNFSTAIIAAFTSSGALDTTNFASGTGYIIQTVPSQGLGATDLLVQSTGDIVSVDTVFSDDPGYLFRYDKFGNQDTTFNQSTGMADLTANMHGQDYGGPYQLVQETDGSIIVVGGEPIDGTLVLAHYSGDGVADTLFGNSGGQGLLYTGLFSNSPTVNSVVVQNDGTIIASGSEPDYLQRYYSDGTADGSLISTGIDGNVQLFNSPTGQLVVGGVGSNSSVFAFNTFAFPTYVSVAASRAFTASGAATATNKTSYTLTLGSNNTNPSTVSTWVINWGDGTANSTYNITPTYGKPVNVTHIYSVTPHAYSISINVSDSSGSQTIIQPVTVVAPISIYGAPTVAHGTNYVLYLQHGLDTGITSWSINWGDGHTSPISGSPASTTHQYSTTGTYSITATATDAVGTFNAATTVTDTAFGTGGVSSTSQSAYKGITTVEPDGSVLVASYSGGSFTVTHYLVDGTLDYNFGTKGTATATFGGSAIANAITVLHNGEIIVAGSDNNSFALAAFLGTGNNAGQVDKSFGASGNGMITTSLGSGFDSFAALAVDANDNILAAGSAASTTAVIYRYSPTGKLDTSFNSVGYINQTSPISNDPIGGEALAIQPDGKIVAADTAFDGDSGFLFRYNASGSLDTTFNSVGSTHLDISALSEYGGAYDLALQSDGDIIVGGGNPYTNNLFEIARYTSTGSVDTTYGSYGIVYTSLQLSARNNSLVVQNDNSVLVASNGVVQRFDYTGSLDTTFGFGGSLTTALSNNDQLFLTPDDKLLLAGASGSTLSMARYLFQSSSPVLVT